MAEINFETEKAEILHTINSETAAAFNRNYELWKSYWVQKAYVTKTYINFSDSTSTETLGWEKVDDFVRVYIEEHPEPEPLPKSITDIEVRLYNSGAFVNYEVNDIGKRKKRETRLMEKENGQWKIAGMHTSIY
ncbi:nuclear transport factor 2 family protein [Roseivirga sp.]|uniref:nuclear transport factor 2 family protein n=1 Tax=Roseivirga sp. TaxID=1964215 RepID=UPI003B8E92D5